MFSPKLLAVLLSITVLTVSSAPIIAAQKDIADYSNSFKKAEVVFPYLNRAVRLVDKSSRLDDDADLPSESDIFYVFTNYSEVADDRKRGGMK